MSPLVVAPDESGSPPGLDDAQQLRYSRHLLLNDWDEACQQRLLAAHALVVGAGGLGAPALMYLAAAGVGRITVIDPDEVELSNLQRQVVHQTARIGWPKVASARQALAELNPEVTDDFRPNEHNITNAQARVPIRSGDSDTDQRAVDIRFEERPINGRHANAGHQMFQPM